MITERVGDLLTEADLTHVAHQANLYHTFGAGLARQISLQYPYAEVADRRSAYGAQVKLGTFSVGEGDGPTVLNLYSQRGSEDGYSECLTDYEALRVVLTAVRAYLRDVPGARLGVPYRLGCGLAGGSWPRVYGLLETIFGDAKVDVVVVRRPEDA